MQTATDNTATDNTAATPINVAYIAVDGTRTVMSAADAMKAHAANGFKGRIETINGFPTVQTPKLTERTPFTATTGKEATVSEIAVARIEDHEKRLNDRGFVLPPPVYAAGTRVVSMGHSNFATSRLGWEETEETVEGLRGIYRAVKREKREDITVNMSQVRMRPDGRLVTPQGDLALEANGLKSLIARNSSLFPRASTYLIDACDPELRAVNFNAQIMKHRPENTVVLRTRLTPHGNRAVFATVSERYTAMDADQIAIILGTALRDSSGMRGEVTYNPETTNLRVQGFYHADQVVDLAAGDVFKVGVEFRSNDAAGGAIIGRGIAIRNLCLNLIILGTSQIDLVNQRHMGSMDGIKINMTAAAERANKLFADFATEWGVLRETKATDILSVPEGDSSGNPIEDAFRAIAKDLDVGIKRDALVEMLLGTWSNEPGDSLADIINAVTRTHALADMANDKREVFEAEAGRLVPILAKRATQTPLKAMSF